MASGGRPQGDDASSRAFDAAAHLYNDDIERQDAVFARFRRVIRAAMAEHLAPGGWVLDLGCGSGADTLWLAANGWSVLAVDPSAAMLEVVRAGAERLGVSGRVKTVRLAAGELAQLRDAPPLIGAVSSLGPLNCEGDLHPVAEALAGVIAPGGPLILSPMARVCPWEIAAYLVRLKPRRALARLSRGPVMAPVSEGAPGVGIPTWYPSPRAFAAPFWPHFDLVSQRGLGVFLPPPYLARPRRHPRMLNVLDEWDERWAGRWPLCNMGDHTLFVMKRR